MSSSRCRFLACLLLMSVAASRVVAHDEIPVVNWVVPPYRAAGSGGGIGMMADISPGVAFVAMQPCRVLDTRGANGPYGGPRLVANAARTFDIDSGPCTGIPAGVDAYSMNFGAILPDGANSFITIWPTGSAQPLVSSINPILGGVVANAAVVPAGTNGQISVLANTGVHLYGDINGYFTDQYNPGVSLEASSATVAPAILGENTSSADAAVAIKGVITSTTPGISAAAIRGINNSTAGTNIGGMGVYGSHAGYGWGVLGESAHRYGVLGRAFGSEDNNIGINGHAAGTSGRTYGVRGQTDSGAAGAAGVFGIDNSGLVVGGDNFSSAGVRGESRFDFGVLGVTNNGAGVRGDVFDLVTGNRIVAGILGSQSIEDYGVYSIGNVHVEGTFTATTNKGFVQPHPHDASKEIRYISLEGPHTEVYFRGTAQVTQGITRIPIPQHFRFVADDATYSTLVTPVGDMATVAVVSEGDEGIVVRASRNVKVHYVVFAEREAVRNPDPVIENVHFRPEPDRDFLAHLPDTFRMLLIQNGTLNSDGTVNMETARRLGWDKEWDKRARPTPQPAD